MPTSSGDGRDERRQDGRDAEQVAGGDAREGGVAHAVADEAHVSLDKEEADGRSKEADHGSRRERQAHELTVEHGRARGRAIRREGAAAARRRRCRRGRGRAGRRCSRRRRTRATRRASSLGGRAGGGRGAARATPVTPRRRRPSARRGRASDGSPASALAMNARCCWPPESSVRSSVGVPFEPDVGDRRVDDRPVAAPERAEESALRRAGRPRRLLGRSPGRARRAGPAGLRSRAWRGARSGARARRRGARCRRSGRASPRTRRTSVVFPPPFGPAIATNSPCSTARSTSLSTGCPGGRRRRRRRARRLAATQALSKRGKVFLHDREVVLAAGKLFLGQPFERVERPRSRRLPRAPPSRRPPARAASP